MGCKRRVIMRGAEFPRVVTPSKLHSIVFSATYSIILYFRSFRVVVVLGARMYNNPELLIVKRKI